MSSRRRNIGPYPMAILFVVAVSVVTWIGFRGGINPNPLSPSFIMAVMIVLAPIMGELLIRYMRTPYVFESPSVQTEFTQVKHGIEVSIKEADSEFVTVRIPNSEGEVSYNIESPSNEEDYVIEDVDMVSSKISSNEGGVVLLADSSTLEISGLDKGCRLQVFTKDSLGNEVLVASTVFSEDTE